MSQCGSDLGRYTKAPAQNIVVLVVRTELFTSNHRVEDHVGRRDLVKFVANDRSIPARM